MGAVAADFLHPLTIGGREEFARLQSILRGADYTERSVCERSGIPSIFDFEPCQKDAYEPQPFRDRLDALLRVLMHGQLARRSDLLAVLDLHELNTFESLGVLAR